MARLEESGAEIKKLTQQVATLRAEGKDARAKSAVELAEVQRVYRELLESRRELDKQLVERGREIADARTNIARLQLDKRALETEARRARQAADNRFAGIALTGRRVLFLVDMSGSMDLIDEQTPAPDKWPLVCETLARIMKSLPDLTDYQVILFSDKVRYALGSDRRWLKYDKESSAKAVAQTLKKIKPKGATDMAAAFAEAFQFRAKGLDTLYVLSDGLPNAGAGLPPGADKLSESQRTAYCSKYVRQMLKNVWNRRTPGQPAVRINAVGFFYESPDVGAFLWAMAREHEGSFVGMSRP
jgi:hypothetical protein